MQASYRGECCVPNPVLQAVCEFSDDVRYHRVRQFIIDLSTEYRTAARGTSRISMLESMAPNADSGSCSRTTTWLGPGLAFLRQRIVLMSQWVLHFPGGDDGLAVATSAARGSKNEGGHQKRRGSRPINSPCTHQTLICSKPELWNCLLQPIFE
jgi:hypothetical protein